MRLRPPAIPLINIDPFISVWSKTDKLNESVVMHWTGADFTTNGYIIIDGKEYQFMGDTEGVLKAVQTKFDFSAMSTFYSFEADGVSFDVTFTSPLLIDDLYYLTRPVSYISVIRTGGCDCKKVSVRIELSEEYCLDKKGEEAVSVEFGATESIKYAKMGSLSQKILNKAGDDHRMNWGYVYLGAADAKATADKKNDMQTICVEKELDTGALFLVGYDDVASIDYFGDHLKSYWNKDGETILEALEKAYNEYDELLPICENLSDRIYLDACKSGGTKYAEMLVLAYRQVLAAHKLAVTKEGEIIYISKECHSNGCAATVDVSYPSIPMFLIYNPELVWGMMRPVYKYASTDVWTYDFAPHDAGRYPLVTGQRYGANFENFDPTETPKFEMQMPVEECGNMLVMEAATAIACGNDVSFAKEHIDVLEMWVKYLLKYGNDPENQLCTDDFAGHLAHNCNLSLKAIMGVASFGIIKKMLGEDAEYDKYIALAKEMALSWIERAKNDDGSFRLAFDRPGTFSMKYNAVWDKLFGTGIFPAGTFRGEIASNFTHTNPYGMPLDNRADYTKSDWLVWTATLAETDEEFEAFVAPLWSAYHHSPTRVPMTDWYFTTTSEKRGFQHRTVQGGLYIKLLHDKGIVKF